MNEESHGVADNDREINIRLQTKGSAPAGDTSEGFALLSEAYNRLYVWECIVSEAELDSRDMKQSRQSPAKELSSYDAIVPAEDELQIEPNAGSQEVIRIRGAPGPLNILKHYFANRRVDWDREAKEPSEDRRLELEKQRIDAVREHVDSLRDIGFPENQVREALSKYIFAPIDRLERSATIEIL